MEGKREEEANKSGPAGLELVPFRKKVEKYEKSGNFSF
jgi:hypothetical protein